MSRRSLGTLTIDVIADVGGFVSGMDKAERAADRWRKETEIAAIAAGTAIGNLVSNAVTGLFNMSREMVNAGVEISKLAQIAGMGTTEFQRYAVGANALGIQQDKLADIFKDTQDKVGDFLQNGGGPLKDFFDNIAPKVGVTAKQFHNLSGPQGLQLYVDSLQKAGVSQQDMVFYLEAIASDATMLLPLLRNGGEGFREFGDAAEAAGAIMGEDTVADAAKLKAQMFLVEQQMKGFKNDLAADILPVLAGIGSTLTKAGEDARGSMPDYDVLGTLIRWVAQVAAGGVASFELLGKSIAGAATIATVALEGLTASDLLTPGGLARRMSQNMAVVAAAVHTVGTDLDATALKWADIIEGFGQAGTSADATSDRVKALAKAWEEYQRILGGNGNGRPDEDKNRVAAQRALAMAFSSTSDEMRRQIALFDTSADRSGKASELQALNYELVHGKLAGLKEPQQEHLRGLATELDRLTAVKTANEQAADAARDYLQLQKDLNKGAGNELELAKERLKVLEAARAAGKIGSDEEYLRVAGQAIGASRTGDAYQGPDALFGGSQGEFGKIDRAAEEERQRYQTQLAALEEFRAARADLAEQWDRQEEELAAKHQANMRTIDDARWQVSMTVAQGALKDVTDTMRIAFGEQSGMYRAAFAVQKAAAIAQAAIAIQAGIAEAAKNPFPANLAAMATVAAATAGIVSNIAAIGMAHDGIDSVPKTGTWLLEKGERVTTAQTSAKLDATLDRVGRDVQGGGRQAQPIHIQVNGDPDQRTLALLEDAVRRGSDQGYGRAVADVTTGTGKISRAMRGQWTSSRRKS